MREIIPRKAWNIFEIIAVSARGKRTDFFVAELWQVATCGWCPFFCCICTTSNFCFVYQATDNDAVHWFSAITDYVHFTHVLTSCDFDPLLLLHIDFWNSETAIIRALEGMEESFIINILPARPFFISSYREVISDHIFGFLFKKLKHWNISTFQFNGQLCPVGAVNPTFGGFEVTDLPVERVYQDYLDRFGFP